MKKIFIVFSLLTFFNLMFAQSYQLDKNFGNNGVLKFEDNTEISIGYKIIPEENGSFLYYSFIQNEEEETVEFNICKYSSEGTLDTNFADNGKLLIPGDYFDGFPPDFCKLPDGRFVVQDYQNVTGIKARIYDENGRNPSEFNLDIFPNELTIVYKCIYNEGNLYFGGNFSFQDSAFVIKTNLEGKIDTNFAENGIFKMRGFNDDFSFFDMITQDSNLLIVFDVYDDNLNYREEIARLSNTGKIDYSFASQGYFTYDALGYESTISVDNKQRIIISVFQGNRVIRLTKDGIFDKEFGTDGIVDLFLNSIPGYYFYHKIMNDNSLLLFGSITNDEDNPFGVPSIAMVSEQGKKVENFGDFGVQVMNIGNLAVNISGDIDKSGNLLVTGAFSHSSDEDFFNAFIAKLKPKSSSITEFINKSDFEVFPNPANSDKIYLKFNSEKFDKVNVEMFDILGNSIMKIDNFDCNDTDGLLTFNYLNTLKNGQYFFLISNGNDVLCKKIIISR